MNWNFCARFRPSLALVSVFVLVGGLGLASAQEAANPPRVTVADTPVDRNARLPASLSTVVRKVGPSVVNIYSMRRTTVPQFMHPFLEDPMLRRFFGERSAPREPRERSRIERSLGSGVIVSEDGYILTNSHVVDGAEDIRVVLEDGRTEHEARLIARDPQTDIAVLKIEATKLTPITLGNSDGVEPGDFVLAVGNPFNVGQTVTMGIVSAVGRSSGILGREGYEDFIQTDAAINQGNSGGALLDIEGRLVGINQSIASSSGGNQGIGFAIPINLARVVMDRLVTEGKVTRGYLGVGIQQVTPDLAKAFKLPDQAGALVGDVHPDTPAAAAGLREGDVIIEYNGRKVNDSRHLRVMVAATAPGAKANLRIIRSGKPRTLTVTLGTLPGDFASAPSETDSPGAVRGLAGLTLRNVDDDAREQFQLPGHVRGAVVTEVEPGTPAAEALRPGDVIVEVDKQPVRDAAAAREAIRKSTGERLILRVWSKTGGFGGSRYVVLNLAERK